ncbi:MAG TPA: Ada metal-binding domain-containing protein [Pyrinomonadaceae bacterium]|jgi:hypothetical protein
MKHLARMALLIILLAAYAPLCAAQEPRCTLKLVQLPSAPELRGFHPGMTTAEVKARVPQVAFGPVDQFGLSKTTINPDFHPQIDKTSFAGVRSVSLDFLDGRLMSLWIGYDKSFKWQTLDEFGAGMSQALHLPNAWQSRQRGRQLNCDDFQLTAMMVAGSPSLRISDELAQRTLTKRIEDAQVDETAEAETEAEPPSIVGDRRSKIFYRTNCPQANAPAEKERVVFATEEEALKAGYKPAKACP